MLWVKRYLEYVKYFLFYISILYYWLVLWSQMFVKIIQDENIYISNWTPILQKLQNLFQLVKIVKRNLKIDCTICRIQSTINTQDNWNGWNSSRKDFIQKTVKEISDLLTWFFCNVTYNILLKISILFPASRLMYNRLQITFLGKFKLFGLWFVLPRIYHLLLM